MGAMMGK